MNRGAGFLGVMCGLLVGAGASLAEDSFDQGWEVYVSKRQLADGRTGPTDAPHDGNGRKYARDREIDVKHLRLELDPDCAHRTLNGVATLSFAPIARPLRQLRLDAVGLHIEKVESSATVEAWDAGKTTLTVTFAQPLGAAAEAWVKVTYTAEPKSGWYYRTEAMGYPAGDDHFWTQGEPETHRFWFPGYDYPNERFTSEVLCRVPAGMSVLSNGRLIEERSEGNRTLFHWSQETEHVNYLVSVIGGYFKKLEAKHGELPIAFLTPPSEFAEAENSFRDTGAILSFLEKEIGVPYPWAKYYNVCVTDFVAGGMENTSIATLTSETLFSKESGNIRTSHRLDAHETTHQWFGDLLTCKDWSHLWLNEGFATYYTHLYDENKSGKDEMLYQLYLDAQGILENPDEKPIVWRGYDDPMEQFDYRVYPKGSWVLQMIRSQLGPELYRRCIRTYVERHRNGNVVTQDLSDVIEEVSGRSWDEFFDQWVYHGGEPVLGVSYSWDQTSRQAKLSIQQAQKVSDAVMLFDFPLPVRFVDANGKPRDFTVRVHEAKEEFFFELPSQPKRVRIDPDLTVLAKVEFVPPDDLLFAQAVAQDDAPGRWLAVRSLAERSDGSSLAQLKSRAETDRFYGVRLEAVRALAKVHSREALQALLTLPPQTDDRVRQATIQAIGSFYADAALLHLKEVVAAEPNPEIVASALSAMGKYPGEEVRGVLLGALERPSYRQRIASAAIGALKDRAEPEVAAQLLAHLRAKEAAYPSSDLGRAWDALAYLARKADPSTREQVRIYLASQIEHPKEVLRQAAIAALGTSEDDGAVALLRGVAKQRGGPVDADAKAADEALTRIRAVRGQAQEVQELRKEVMDLQKELQAVRDGLEEVRKKTQPGKSR
jgi:aminopeptidase N